MKNKFIILFLIPTVLLLVGCNRAETKEQQNGGEDERVLSAIEMISERWSDAYKNSSLDIEDKYLEITNTKIINIKSNEIPVFKDVDYIVEFSLESNYYNSAPYYSNIGARDSFVAVYTDGKSEILGINPFNSYIRQNGPTDFQDIIASIENFHGEYDQILELE